eukprot:TRINITY_DN407_c0_g1_i4.p1 TRINITY_DN407_c0_g1~~TRINITY_DN407_c0_g1_i4.p1  ORF type:complete len:593 (+),score=137.52 TRINITY_DN407_c0_g1_i4:82-1860(+)
MNQETIDEIAFIKELYKKDQAQAKIRALQLINERYKADAQVLNLKLQHHNKQEDVVKILRQELNAKEETILAAQSRTAELEAEQKAIQRDFDRRWEEEHTHHEQQIQMLRVKVDELNQKYNSLSKFDKEKDKLEKELERLKQRQQEEKELHALQIEEMAKKNNAEREALKKEMLSEIKKTKQVLLSLTQDTLHPTTKRTQQENEQMSSELAYQSRENEKLVQKNKLLRAENEKIKASIRQKAENEKVLATRTHFFQKLIRKLQEKIKQAAQLHQDAVQHSASRGGSQGSDKGHLEGAASQFARQELIKSLQSRYEELQQACQNQQDEVQRLVNEYHHLQQRHETLIQSQDEGTTLFLTSLEHVKIQMQTEKKRSQISLEELDSKDRERVLGRLFQKLHGYHSHHQASIFDDLLSKTDSELPTFSNDVSTPNDTGPAAMPPPPAPPPPTTASPSMSRSGSLSLPPLGGREDSAPKERFSAIAVQTDFKSMASATPSRSPSHQSPRPPPSSSSSSSPSASPSGAASPSPAFPPSTASSTGSGLTTLAPFSSSSVTMLSSGITADGPVRQWGKRSVTLPLTSTSPASFLRKSKRF